MQGLFSPETTMVASSTPPPKQVFCSLISVALVLQNAGKTEGLAAWGSVCGGTEWVWLRGDTFAASYITCIFAGGVGSSEASVRPRSISEKYDLHCVSSRLELIGYIHTAAQFL